MNAIEHLERLGYEVTLREQDIYLRCTKQHPDPVKVQPLVAKVREHKAEAVTFLKLRELPDTIALNELHLYADRLTPEEWRQYYPLE